MNSRVIVVLIVLIVSHSSADYHQDSWQEPDAWERHSPSGFIPSTCPVCNSADESVLAAFYYRKLVTHLFNKQTLKADLRTGQLQKDIRFSLTAAQLDVIENSGDIRDLDNVVTKILGSTTFPRCNCGTKETENSGGIISLVGDIFKDVGKLLKVALSSSEIRFLCFITGVIMLIFFIHIRYNRSIIAVVTIIFILFGYIYTYLECNRKLETEDFITLIKESEPEVDGWFRKTYNTIFRISKQDEQILKVQKKTKIGLPFCRPDHVLMMYINDMFLNQFELIIGKCMDITLSFKNKLTFPFNYIAMLLLPMLFCFIVKLMFEHILSPIVWFRAIRGDNTHQHQQHQQQPQLASHEDRISGPNLKILLETFSASIQNAQPSSGVQEILESLDPPPREKILNKSSSEDDFKSNNNVTICDVIEDEKAEHTP